MSTTTTTLFDFVDTLRRWVLREIHPLAQMYVHEGLDAALDVDAHGDMAEAVRLLRLARDKITDELQWEAVKYASVHHYRDAYQLRRRADRLTGRGSF